MLDTPPTLIECVRFRGRERRINIPQEIGVKYYQFGLFLLEDDTGARIQSIAHKHMNDAEQINMEVLEKWITGRGKQPITWKTLTEVLRDIEISTLAGEIEAVKCCEDNPVGASDDSVQNDQTMLTAETTNGTRHMHTAGIEDEHCKTVATNLLSDSEYSNKKEKNPLDRNFEARLLAIDCEDSEENQEKQRTLVPHGTGVTDIRALPLIQDEVLD